MKPLGIGGVGTGGFGLFALQHFLQVPETRLIAIAGTHQDAALAMARRFAVECHEEPGDLLADPAVDLIYIATPPFLHAPQARAALEAGKHVIVEKPLALDPDEARKLVTLARSKNLLLVANQMQRYNPMFEAVREVIRSGMLGRPLHGFFENYASDEGLGPDHWFWDREKSGGIFLEHAVHFFDLFEGWLGEGEVVAAQRVLRPGSGFEEQVQCTARYSGDVLVNFYHGFTQPGRLDRQEFRLLFERGDITLEEWIPIRAKVRAMVDEVQSRQLMEIFPGARLDVLEVFAGAGRKFRGRHHDFDASQRVELSWGLGEDKQRRYGELLRAFLADQLAWIAAPAHQRVVTETNGLRGVEAAAAANRLADEADTEKGRTVSRPAL